MPSSHLTLILMALLTAAPLALKAEESTDPASATGQDALAAHGLAAQLPQVADISVVGSKVFWHDEGSKHLVAVVGIDESCGDLLIETDMGSLRIPRHLIADHHTELLGTLPSLVSQAQHAGLASNTLVLQLGMLTGPSLRDRNQALVLPDGVLLPHPLEAMDRSSEITRISSLSKALITALPSTALDALACTTLQHLLSKLAGHDGSEQSDVYPPSFARQLARHGYLRPWFSSTNTVIDSCEQAVATAVTMTPTRILTNGTLSYEEVSDAFGNRAWVYRHPDAISYGYQEPRAQWMGKYSPDLFVVVDLPIGADPQRDADKAIAARIYDTRSNVLATWDRDQGLIADEKRWRTAVPIQFQDVPDDAIPPHILIRSLNGDVSMLVVRQGLLHPPTNSTPASGEQFLDDAARLLPDQAHLDLIGEYLFQYAYTSPEAKHPRLIGERDLISDVQRTAAQTVGDCSGGIMHGNCADIADVYQEVLGRQHHHALDIGLPEHAACCWVAPDSGGWTVRILQTGAPMYFNAATLPQALKEAYTSFDPAMSFDQSALPILLRFSGESTRGKFTLGYRIFSEPAYCQTLVDVQRDLQYETYHRGITSMAALIANGDDDVANYLELSGLYIHTGQFAKAAEYCTKAAAHTTDQVSRLNLAIRNIKALMLANRQKEAEEAAREVLTVQLPATLEEIGAEPRIVMSFINVTLNQYMGPDLHALALKAMSQHLIPPLSQLIHTAQSAIRDGSFNQKQWTKSSDGRAARSLLSEYCHLGLALLDELGPAAKSDPDAQLLIASLQGYFDDLIFRDVEETDEVMEKYEDLAHWYRLTLGDAAFERLLEQSTPATDGTIDHTDRHAGPGLQERDLHWIRASVPYWNRQLFALFGRDHDCIDLAKLHQIAGHLTEAVAATGALGLADRRTLFCEVMMHEMVALSEHDPVALRKAFKACADENDKYLRDSATRCLGQYARFFDTDWFNTALLIWSEEIDYKPKYLLIAWSAALNQAPAQALQAASLAAKRFPDDPSFSEEYDFIKAQLTPKSPDSMGTQHHDAPVPATSVPAK